MVVVQVSVFRAACGRLARLYCKVIVALRKARASMGVHRRVGAWAHAVDDIITGLTHGPRPLLILRKGSTLPREPSVEEMTFGAASCD